MADPVTIDLRHVARGLGIPLRQVEAVVELLDDGNTVPFITRYRKDQTGGLDEEPIRQIQARLKKLRLLAERKETILRSIEAQGKLTEKLSKQILAASTTKRLEDLYLPYRPKKQTLATTARWRGLEPLAQEILQAAVPGGDLDARANDFVQPDRGVKTAAEALLGAGHILAELFSERADLRHRLREILQRSGRLVCSQVVAEPKTASDKKDKSASGVETSAAPHGAGSWVSSETTASPSAPATQTSSSREEIAGGWIAPAGLPGEAVISHDTAETVDTPVDAAPNVPPDRGDAQGAARAGPIEAVVFGTALEPTSVPGLSVVSAGEECPAWVGEAEGATTATTSEVAESGSPAQTPSAERAGSGEHGPAAAPEAPAPAPPAPESPAPMTARGSKPTQAELLRAKKELKKKKAEERRQKAFRDYFNYAEEIRRIPPHRVLAINRGERARVLRVKVECDLEAMHHVLDEVCVPAGHPHAEFLRGCARDALARLILPSLEREVRRELTERAEAHAVGVFARNLRNLLLASPVRDRRVLAVDPGYRSGCKLVALDAFGNVLGHNTIYLVGKPERREEARRIVTEMIEQYQLNLVAIGNGTACRLTEEFFAELIGAEVKDKGVCYVIVNEAGASVYSTSRIGREEFPQYDASVRGAISIGRRLQDPLSELVKIEPPNLGVGLYQHDLKANHLRESLDEVVESCVNYVGVDLNTASPALLRYVSGLNQLTARRIYEYRLEHGPFRNREQLKEVPGIGEATFVQAAGFLKIVGGDNPLDATWIHPESYSIATRVMERLGIRPEELVTVRDAASLAERTARVNVEAMAADLQVGAMLLKDILAQLVRPGRDPREDLPPPVFKRGVLKLEDLTPGMELSGTVLNVVDFGAFVDIGMHDSGLVHVSQLADRFVRDPHDVVAVGDIVRVWVLEVDKQRRRVSLTMIPPGQQRAGLRRTGKASGPARAEAQRPPREPPRAGGPAPEQSAARSEPPRGEPGRAGQGAPRPSDRTPPRSPPKPRTPPRPITPITDEMKSGKEPMRSFSDLMQFYGLQASAGGGRDRERPPRNRQRHGKPGAPPSNRASRPEGQPPRPEAQPSPPEAQSPATGPDQSPLPSEPPVVAAPPTASEPSTAPPASEPSPPPPGPDPTPDQPPGPTAQDPPTS